MRAEQILPGLRAGWGSGFRLVRELVNGTTAPVVLVERDNELFVAKAASVTEASATWQATLLRSLADRGMIVPLLLPTPAGMFTYNGLVLMAYIDGRPPETSADWESIRTYLGTLHTATSKWPSRPDMPSVVELAQARPSLRAGMSHDAEQLIRRAWAGIAGMPTSVIHGDPNEYNVRITPQGPALIDWGRSQGGLFGA